MHATEGSHQQLVGALFVEVSPRRVGVAVLHGQLDLVQRHAVSPQCVRVDQHLKLLATAAHRKHLRDAGDCQQPLPYHPVGQRPQLQRVGRPVFAPHSQHQDLAHDRRDRSQLWLNARRQPLCDQLQSFVDNLSIVVNIGAPIEFDVNDRHADARRATYGLYTVGSIQGRFQREGNQRFDFFWCHSRRFGHDDDARTIQIRKDVDRRLYRLPAAIAHQQQRDCNGQQALL